METSLSIIPRFSEHTPELLGRVAAAGRVQSIARGEVLFLEGDLGSSVYFVLNGSVKISKHLNNGRKVLLDILGPGESADEWAVLSGLPHFTSAEVHDNADVFVIGRDKYLGLLAAHPDRIYEQMRDLSKQVAGLMRRLSELAAGSVQARLAFLLFTLHQKFGHSEGEKLTIEVPLTRQDIADMVGTTVETAIRTMSRFQKRKIVLSTDTGISILKPDCLQSIAENNCDCVHNPCHEGMLRIAKEMAL